MSYRVAMGDARDDDIPDDVARAVFDLTPEHLRTGDREGSFILWDEDPRGWRTRPRIFRRAPADAKVP